LFVAVLKTWSGDVTTAYTATVCCSACDSV